ncbi:lysozyme inhibitor LprI family protein [Burkholderia cepacia]|uniref:lysozyme inhibitor LprI family protein n=1 Tax=Burkholderia cepacia TaxID=292 RepID=UPI0009C011FC|nr:lysozyme inhibitor LprI family protein [Burkholderia cepacia]
MKHIAITPMALVSGSAFSKTACIGQINTELTACAQENYKSADAALNNTYKDALGKINSTDKQNLISAQRAWVAYKDKYCSSAFDATSPGAEASIDKWSCLTSVTESRTSEIRYISSSIGMD